ncbi:MAG: hypothetical protein GY869_20380 [Planctomycetes bacterium]|nr:hypothetical protein [Planctomycetota bacterium]
MAMIIGIVGCGDNGDTGGPAVPEAPKNDNENTPIAEIQAAVANMDLVELEANATKFKDAILAKQGDFTDLTEQVKSTAVTEIEKLAQLKGDLDDITASIDALKKRLTVYVEQINKMGGDGAAFDIKI